jgi:DNA-binding MarR family transcriptional regulator
MVATDEVADAFVAASRALVGIAVHSIGAAPVEVTVAQYRLLVLVAASDRTVGDIAVRLGVNQSNASRHCNRLQRLGLLERSRSMTDRRVVHVHLTPAGRHVVNAVTNQRRVEVRRVLDRLSSGETAAILDALRAFNAAVGGFGTEFDDAPWAVHQW